MIYNSLFREEDFSNKRVYKYNGGRSNSFSPSEYYLSYEGTLESVLRDLESMTDVNLGERDSRQKIIWGAPRIIRGVLDYKSTTSSKTRSYNALELVLTATQAVIDIYENPLRITQAVSEVRDYFSNNPALNGILNTEVKQQKDYLTFESTSPVYSDNTVNCLLNKFKGRDILFIISAHGGVPAGLDVFLKYQAASQDGDSMVYPVRYSTDKFDDCQPRIERAEIKYLKDSRRNRPVVIFDEDIAGGETMRGMKKFFSGGIFPEKRIFVRANQCGEKIMIEMNGFEWKPEGKFQPEDDDLTVPILLD